MVRFGCNVPAQGKPGRKSRKGVSHLGVGDVEGGDGLHAKLWGVLRGKVLRVVGAIEVIPCDAALAARHVAPYDEVRAAWPNPHQPLFTRLDRRETVALEQAWTLRLKGHLNRHGHCALPNKGYPKEGSTSYQCRPLETFGRVKCLTLFLRCCSLLSFHQAPDQTAAAATAGAADCYFFCPLLSWSW